MIEPHRDSSPSSNSSAAESQNGATLVESLDSAALATVDWPSVQSAAYMIHQRFRYTYPGDIWNLRQRLMVIPPERHGDQRLVMHRLETTSPTTEVRRDVDQHGNLALIAMADYVTREIDFTIWLVVERTNGDHTIPVPEHVYAGAAFREPDGLTETDEDMDRCAGELAATFGPDPADLARGINRWVYEAFTYAPGETTVHTSAAAAFKMRRGVCQDYSHVMIALCRRCGVPARYVSGHLLGEGPTHAWVEALLPDPDRPGQFVAQPYDPTHGSIPGLNYVTVAVGRDYADVAPTSGTFVAPYPGELTATKRAGMAFLTLNAPAS